MYNQLMDLRFQLFCFLSARHQPVPRFPKGATKPASLLHHP